MRLLTLIFCFAASGAYATAIDLTQLTYGGNGCAAGGAGVTARLSKTGDRVIVATPDAVLDVTAKGLDRKACAIALTVSVQPNERVVIGGAAVLGKESLGAGDTVVAANEVFLAGTTGPKTEFNRVSTGGTSTDFYQRDSGTLTGDCGVSQIVRANASIRATKASDAGGAAQLKGLAFDVKTETCPAAN